MSGLTTLVTQTGISMGAVKTLAAFLALGIGAYWTVTLFRRTFRSDDDPSYRKWSQSRVGSASFLVSGAYFSTAIATAIALLTWPTVIEEPLVGAALLFGVVYHAALEYRESTQ